MAEALWNDIVYTDVLQSDGFVVDYAVCTTYKSGHAFLIVGTIYAGYDDKFGGGNHALSPLDSGDYQSIGR